MDQWFSNPSKYASKTSIIHSHKALKSETSMLNFGPHTVGTKFFTRILPKRILQKNISTGHVLCDNDENSLHICLLLFRIQVTWGIKGKHLNQEWACFWEIIQRYIKAILQRIPSKTAIKSQNHSWTHLLKLLYERETADHWWQEWHRWKEHGQTVDPGLHWDDRVAPWLE